MKRGDCRLKHTVHTIAKHLGVAPSTVSKIVNNTGNFSDEIRERVLKYIREIDYVPAASARTLKANKSWTIGVIYTEESNVGLEHPFFSSVLQAFKDEVEKVGYDIAFIVKRVGQHEMSYLSWCRNKKIDGALIVIGSHTNPGIIELVNSDIPCISTDVVMDHLPLVVSDNDQGITLSIDHSLALGRKKIALIAGPFTARHFLYRFRVYQRVMEERGLPYSESNVVSARGFGYSSGIEAAKKLLKKVKEIPETIIVGSDLIAFGVIHGLEQSGYHVPNDISVIGFDDISFARIFAPSLTTIRQNSWEIGSVAAKTLLKMIDRKTKNGANTIRIPVELVERDSTAKLKSD